MVRAWNHKQLIFTVRFPKTHSPVVTLISTWHILQIKSQQLLILEFIWSLFWCSTVLQIYLIRGRHQSYHYNAVFLLLLTLHLHIIDNIYKFPSSLPSTTKQNRYCSFRFHIILYLITTVFPYHLPFMKTLSYVHISTVPEISQFTLLKSQPLSSKNTSPLKTEA